MVKTILALVGLTLSLSAHAATVTLNSVQAGTTYDPDGDGYFDYALSGSSQNLVVRNFVGFGSNTFEDRGFAEFSFADIHDISAVNSMQLTFDLVSVTSNTERVVNVVGYEGGDANFLGNLGASSDIALGSFDSWALGLGTHTINLNFNNNDLAALLANNTLGLRFEGDLTINAAIQNSVSLMVDYSVVPVPAAVWLFGSGLIGLVGLARRKKV